MTDDELGLEEGKTLARAIAGISLVVDELIGEHCDEFGEILSTILLDRLADWYVGAHRDVDPSRAIEADRLAAVLADQWVRGNETMRTAIATGFLEALPSPHRSGREVVDRLPTVLREELRRMEEWRPTT